MGRVGGVQGMASSHLRAQLCPDLCPCLQGPSFQERFFSGSCRRRGLSYKSPLCVCLVADTNHPLHPSVLLNPEILWAGDIKKGFGCVPNEGAKQAAVIHLGDPLAAGICLLSCLNRALPVSVCVPSESGYCTHKSNKQ